MNAIVIPVHKDKFDRAIKVTETFNKFVTNGDLFLVFSNEDELNYLKTITNEKFNSIVIDNDKIPNIITYKKFFGVNYVFNKNYDYIGIVDCETEFVKQLDLSEIQDIYKSKIFKTNTSSNGGRIVKKCADALEYTDIVSQITDNYSQYWWFNDLCVYEKGTFTEFYESILTSKNYNMIMSDSEYFDYFLYSIWLLVNKDFKLKNYMPHKKFVYGILEHNFYDDEISYSYKSMLDANQNHANIPFIKILFNVDRYQLKHIYLDNYHECV